MFLSWGRMNSLKGFERTFLCQHLVSNMRICETWEFEFVC